MLTARGDQVESWVKFVSRAVCPSVVLSVVVVVETKRNEESSVTFAPLDVMNSFSEGAEAEEENEAIIGSSLGAPFRWLL